MARWLIRNRDKLRRHSALLDNDEEFNQAAEKGIGRISNAHNA